MPQQYEYISVEVDDTVIDSWVSYRVESDIFTAADSWSLQLPVASVRLASALPYLRDKFYPGVEVKIFTGHRDTRALQMIGVVDRRTIRNDARGGTVFTLDGRDRAAYLVDNAAPLDVFGEDDTIGSFAEKAMERFGIKLQGDATINRRIMSGGISQKKVRAIQMQAEQYGIPSALLSDKIAASIERGTLNMSDIRQAIKSNSLNALPLYQVRIKEARPQASESIWEYIERHARRNGALLRMNTDGNLMLMGIDDGQSPTYAFNRLLKGTGNNILSGGESYDLSTAYSECIVYGKAKQRNAASSKYKGHAKDTSDDAPTHAKILTVYDAKIRNQADAQKRAEYELAKSRQGMRVLEYVMRGHGQAGTVYTPDTTASVDDEVAGIDAIQYMTGRTFEASPGTGPTTTVRLVPKGSIVLLGEDTEFAA